MWSSLVFRLQQRRPQTCAFDTLIGPVGLFFAQATQRKEADIPATTAGTSTKRPRVVLGTLLAASGMAARFFVTSSYRLLNIKPLL